MSVDNRLVAQLVNDSLARQIRQHPGERLVDVVGYAMDELKGRRNDPQNPQASLDENLAAAEHYMVARWAVGASAYSQSQMRVMVLAYESFKMLLGAMPGYPYSNARHIEVLMRHNPARPTAPPSQELIGWGLAGAEHGEADRVAVGGAYPPFLAFPPAYAPIVGGG
jgi:hypothetical protein